MVSDNTPTSPRLWAKDLFNGFLAWLIAFILYLVPAFVIAIPMSFTLGPKLRDSAEVARQISQAVAGFYESTALVHYAYILVLALLILWKAFVVTRRFPTRPIAQGLRVAIIPLILGAIPMALGGHVLLLSVAIVAFIGAGIIGATRGVLQR